MSFKDSIKSKVISGVLTGVILGILGYLATLIWPPFQNWMISVFNFVLCIAVARITISFWLFSVIFLVALIPVIQSIIALRKARTTHCIPERTWRDFREGIYFGIKWKWEYNSNGTITHLVAYCPKCGLQLTYQDVRVSLYQVKTSLACDDCGGVATIDGDHIEAWKKVMRQIERDIDTEAWKTK